MSAAELVLESARRGVLLFCRDGQLGFDLTVEEFPPSLKAEIVANKAALIAYLSALQNVQALERRPPVLPLPRTSAPVVTSFAQQRLWFIDQLGGSSQYNMPGAMRVAGSFDEGVAERALARIVQRHEPLRTVFVDGADGPLQWIREDARFVLERVDLRPLHDESKETAIADFVASDVGASFDLSRDLMLRAAFLRTSDDAGVFVFNMHHIASDGWSMGVLMHEFVALYAAFSAGLPDPLPPLTIRYADYAQWQRQWLAGDVLERQLGYWEKQLADLPPLHSLPLDKPRPSQQTFNGAVHGFSVEAETLAVLKQLALAHNATLFMLLHAAFALLLSRQSGSTDIVIGTPVANRLQQELEPLVGFFVNTLVLRANCQPGLRFDELLEQVRRVNLDAQANQDVPFEYLVERLNPARNASHSALFQIVFNMNTTGDAAEQTPPPALPWQMRPFFGDGTAVKFDLSLEATETPGGIMFRLFFNRDLFDPERMQALRRQMVTLLRGIAAQPATSIERLPLLDQSDLRYLLDEVHQAPLEFPRLGLHELFERQAAATPDATALVCGATRLSFAELNRRANRLAHWLRERGVGPDVLVGLALDRSERLFVAVLGVLKAGGAYVPIDPAYPRQRREFIAADSGIRLLLSDADMDAELLDAYPDSDPVRAGGWTQDSLAYVIYTSGSTGTPKGVLVEHRGVVNFGVAFLEQLRSLAVAPLQAWLLTASMSFDASLKALVALYHGSCVVIADDNEYRDPVALVALLRAHAVPVFNGMPQLVEHVLDELELHDDIAVSLIVSGDDVPPRLWQRLRDYTDSRDRRALNAYGPTETSVNATYSTTDLATGINIGRVIPNLRGYLFDAYGQLVPPGGEGELNIGGTGLARGYLDRPVLTAEKFIDNPYRPGERLYRTGDRMRYRGDGSLVFAGRGDGQVKVRGFRIETGEIDAVLATLPGVSAAATIVRDDALRGAQLVSYVVGESADGDIAAWMAALRERLPEYMLPAVIQPLSQLPLSPNGKLDRAALPAPVPLAVVHIEPETASEQALAEVWRALLGLSSVSVTAGFFELGGHSLLATRLVAQIQRQLGVKLQLAQIFRHQTIRALAAQIDSQNDETARPLHDGLILLADAGGAAPPLLLIHPVGGDAHCYAELASVLNYAGPVYGVQAAESGADSIAAMAAQYCERIQAQLNPSAWRLAGWSMGGSVAFEMACQLRARGAAVDSLVLFDSFHPELIRELAGSTSDDAALLSAMAAEVGFRFAPAQRDSAPGEAALVEQFLRRGREQRGLPDELDAESVAQRLRITRRNSQALRSYQPPRYDGEIVLMRAAENLHAERRLGWERVATRVRVSEHGGNHASMFRRPHVAALAAALNRQLRLARSPSANPDTTNEGEIHERSH